MCKKYSKAKMAKFAVGILLFVSLVPYITMLLWNALMPVIFGLKSISYLQAFGLLILSKILFSGFSHIGAKKHEHWKPQPEHIRKFQEGMRRMAEVSKEQNPCKAPFRRPDAKE